jgi:large conductance mechanosensitive channel
MKNDPQGGKSMLKEFRAFIERGNVIDLAVAVIIGGAFGAIINSLVNDIFMPAIGMVIGGIDFSGLALTVGDEQILYGNFIQATVNFLIIAFALFLMVRAVNRLQDAEEEAEEEPPAEPPAEEKLLTEIRDLLKAQR